MSGVAASKPRYLKRQTKARVLEGIGTAVVPQTVQRFYDRRHSQPTTLSPASKNICVTEASIMAARCTFAYAKLVALQEARFPHPCRVYAVLYVVTESTCPCCTVCTVLLYRTCHRQAHLPSLAAGTQEKTKKKSDGKSATGEGSYVAAPHLAVGRMMNSPRQHSSIAHHDGADFVNTRHPAERATLQVSILYLLPSVTHASPLSPSIFLWVMTSSMPSERNPDSVVLCQLVFFTPYLLQNRKHKQMP